MILQTPSCPISKYLKLLFSLQWLSKPLILLIHSGSQKENVYFIRGCLTLIYLKTHVFNVEDLFKLIANATNIMIKTIRKYWNELLFNTVLTFKTPVFLLFQLFETPYCFTSRIFTKQFKTSSIEKSAPCLLPKSCLRKPKILFDNVSNKSTNSHVYLNNSMQHLFYITP